MTVFAMPSPAIRADRASAAREAAAFLAAGLAEDLAAQGEASLFVSGGSTPGQLFDLLAGWPLDWAGVSIGLVDERVVPSGDARANETLVRRRLLVDRAAAARFVPLTPPPTGAASAVAPLLARPTSLLLGMGVDGHTASWFLGAKGTEAAMDQGCGELVASVDADGSPAASGVPRRLTLTATAFARARRAMLLFFGEAKKSVYDRIAEAGALSVPIGRAAKILGDRLRVEWAP